MLVMGHKTKWEMSITDAMNMSRSICLGRRLRALLLLVMLAATALTLQAGVAITNLYSFTGGDDGGNPEWALTQGSDGTLRHDIHRRDKWAWHGLRDQPLWNVH